MKARFPYTILGAAVMLLLGLLVSCTRKSTDFVSIEIDKTIVSSSKGSLFVNVNASGDWTISIRSESGEMEWLWFEDWDDKEGAMEMTRDRAADKPVLLLFAENHGKSARSCTIEARCEDAFSSIDFTQQRGEEQIVTPSNPISDDAPMWLELPQMNNPDCFYVNHEMKLGSYQTIFRNFSLYMSRKDIVAHWVAYPLNAWTISSGVDRTNDWNLDPKIPRNCQPVIFSPFANSGTYARGHQIPSADRYGDGANQQTFYGSNMTPQMHSFNSPFWSTLEGKVRSWSRQFDTLYVVTGCDTRTTLGTTRDNDLKNIAIPSAYYKVLLGFKKTKSGTTPGQYYESSRAGYSGYYSGTAFYLQHKECVNTNAENIKADINAGRMTIDQLEAMLGENFFVNLSKVLSEAAEVNIEQGNDTFWRL